MIKYANNLLLTEKTEKKLKKIKKAIDNRSVLSRACIIMMSENTDDVFEIIPIMNLWLSNKYDDITIVGLTENNSAAVSLISELAEQFVNLKCDMSMREYFINYFNLTEGQAD